MVVVGGVPGAGKSTVLRPYAGRRDVTVLDPDTWRDGLRWRPLVHGVHQALVWGAVLLGPALVGPLLVHDTATRPRRRTALLRLARLRGWNPSLVLVDVDRTAALTGQLDRGRLVPAGSFERHWARWQRLRSDPAGTRWAPTFVVARDHAPAVVAALALPAGRMAVCSPHPVDCCS
jgi:hypothetical protein